MKMKASAVAYASQALIAFHGYSDETRRTLPVDTLFCSLTNLYSTTTIEFSDHSSENLVFVNGRSLVNAERQRVEEFIFLLANQYNLPRVFHLESKNSFPSRCGLGSSGSAFASIVQAIGTIVNEDNKRTLSKLARIGSISAASSLVGGVSVLHAGSEQLWADQVIEPAGMPIAAVCVIVNASRDTIDIHREARCSPLYDTVAKVSRSACSAMCEALKAKDFSKIAEIAQRQLTYNMALLSTGPSHLLVWRPETIAVAQAIANFRAQNNIPAVCAMNSGPSLFCYVPKEHLDSLTQVIKELGVTFISCMTAGGAKAIKEHLF